MWGTLVLLIKNPNINKIPESIYFIIENLFLTLICNLNNRCKRNKRIIVFQKFIVNELVFEIRLYAQYNE